MIVLVLYFTFLGGTFTTDFNYWPRVVHHIVVSLGMALWLVSLLRQGRSLPVTPLDRPLLALFLSYALATALAVDPRVSVESLWQIGFHILLFYVLVDIMRTWKPRTVLEPIFFVSAVVILVGLMEFFSWYFGLGWLSLFQQGWFQIGGLRNPIPPVIYRVSFTLGVSTFLSGYLALLTPVGLAWWLSASNRDTRRGLGLWLLGALIVQFLSFSRGGLLSLAVSIPLFGLLYLLSLAGWRERIGFALRDRRIWLGGTAALTLLGIVGLLWLRQSGLSGHASGDSIRIDLWQSAWNVGVAHPLVGVGPYGFGRAMRQFRDPAITGDHLTSAHNIPLQLWAEAGLLGVMSLVVLVGTIASTAWRRWYNVTGIERIRLAGVIAALTGFSVHNLFDTLASTSILLPCLVLVAFLVTPVQSEQTKAPLHWRRVVPLLALITVALSAIGWVVSDTAHYYFDQAVQLSAKGNLKEAVRSIRTAQRVDPAMGYYLAEEAYYLGRLAAQDPDYLEGALAVYRSLLSRENTYGLNRANYAMLLAQSGRMHEAQDEMLAARALDPVEVRYQLWSGSLADEAGIRTVALEAYLETLNIRPSWIGSSYWDKTDLRSETRLSFLERYGMQDWPLQTLSRLTPQCWQVRVPLRRWPADDLSPSQELSCQGEINLRVSQDVPGALQHLSGAIEADATWPWPYLLRAEAYLEKGDLEPAERDARMALFLGDNRAYYLLGRIAEASGDTDAAIQAYLKGIPQAFQLQGWDVAVYDRRGDLTLLPQLDAPGPGPYDLASALALTELYEGQGRETDARAVRDMVYRLDPYFELDSP